MILHGFEWTQPKTYNCIWKNKHFQTKFGPGPGCIFICSVNRTMCSQLGAEYEACVKPAIRLLYPRSNVQIRGSMHRFSALVNAIQVLLWPHFAWSILRAVYVMNIHNIRMCLFIPHCMYLSMQLWRFWLKLLAVRTGQAQIFSEDNGWSSGRT